MEKEKLQNLKRIIANLSDIEAKRVVELYENGQKTGYATIDKPWDEFYKNIDKNRTALFYHVRPTKYLFRFYPFFCHLPSSAMGMSIHKFRTFLFLVQYSFYGTIPYLQRCCPIDHCPGIEHLVQTDLITAITLRKNSHSAHKEHCDCNKSVRSFHDIILFLLRCREPLQE